MSRRLLSSGILLPKWCDVDGVPRCFLDGLADLTRVLFSVEWDEGKRKGKVRFTQLLLFPCTSYVQVRVPSVWKENIPELPKRTAGNRWSREPKPCCLSWQQSPGWPSGRAASLGLGPCKHMLGSQQPQDVLVPLQKVPGLHLWYGTGLQVTQCCWPQQSLLFLLYFFKPPAWWQLAEPFCFICNLGGVQLLPKR